MSVTLIDSHCHLDFPDFEADIDGVIARARAAGVERMITIGTRIANAGRLKELAEAHEEIFFTVGTHPHDAGHAAFGDEATMRAYAEHPKCVGLGEAGLDYHYNYAPPEAAQRVFRTQIALARELRLPIVVHTREADDDMTRILREEMAAGRFAGLLHCFTSSRALAETALELGLYISFSGVITFKNSEGLRELARDIPLDRILVETDSPYLTPAPHRGRRNEPAFVAYTAKAVAAAKGVTIDQLAAATRANTLKLFDKIEGRG